jgi:hypothetical protein
MARIPHSTSGSSLPTADDVKAWPLSKLLSSYVQVVMDPVGTTRGKLRQLYAAEIDRRLPVP